MKRHVVAVVGGVLFSAVGMAPAQAATYASSGERCTIVGTSKADTLRGTGGRDVICGLGGNDVLDGRGGSDVLDGGSGTDTVTYTHRRSAITADIDGRADDGAKGEGDRILTTVENLIGGSGADRLTAGTRGSKLDGGAGGDELTGGRGPDKLYGGDGNDTLRGGAGSDTLWGGGGNDDLDGGDEIDTLDGGTGTNTCGGDGPDTLKRCAPDTAAPSFVSGSASPNTVDVTDADRSVVMRFRIKDDTGVASVEALPSHGGPRLRGFAERVSGTARDGVWELRGSVPRYSPPGTTRIELYITDRSGRQTWEGNAALLKVLDRNPDTEPPTVQSFAVSHPKVDVTKSAVKIRVTAKLKDNLSGVGFVQICAVHPAPDGSFAVDGRMCTSAELAGGTTRNGTWTGDIQIRKGSGSGTWNFTLQVFDRANYVDESRLYVGPDIYAAEHDEDTGEMPGARLTVIGSS